jgi:hypothetical protein
MTKWMCGLVALVSLVFVPQAFGAYTSVGSFADQAPDGDFVHQQRIAVNRTAEKLYLADTVGDQVRVFAAASTASVEGTPIGTGVLNDPLGIAVDQQTGDVYVSDDDDVVKFDSSGVLDPTFVSPGVTGALAFDQVADELLVADGGVVRRYSPTGAAGATFNGSNGSTAFAGLQDIAVDSTGDVLVVDSTGDPALGTGASRVERFSATGAYEATFGPVYGAATVTVEPGSDRVIVSGNQDAIGRAASATIDIFDPATPATPTESPISTSQYSTIRGMAVDGANRLYVSSDLGIFPSAPAIYGNINVQAFEVAPEVAVGASTGVTTEAATLHGTVNPHAGGISTSYRYEISSDDGASWTPIDPDGDGDEDAGSGTASVAVSETVTGLMPSTTYRVRLVAVRGAVTVTSAEATLRTIDIAPDVSDVRAAAASSTIRVSAKINPNRGATTYVVEYGPTTAYGRSFPVTPATIDPGSDPVYVTKTIAGLTPSTSYHLRVVATNSGGVTASPDKQVTTIAAPKPEPEVTDTCPNAAERATQGSSFLPECRAYEQISPVEKNGGAVSVGTSLRARPDGDGALIGSTTALPGAPGRPGLSFYRSLRSADGWLSRSVDPPIYNTNNHLHAQATLAYSRDMSSYVVMSRRALAPGAVAGRGNLYRYDVDTGTYEFIANGPDNSNVLDTDLFFDLTGPFASIIEADDALRHVVITTDAPLTADAAPGVNNVYEWTQGEGLRVVNRLPDGTVNPSGGTYGTVGKSRPNIMSRDGTRLFLSMNGALYMARGEQPLQLLSASRRAGDDPTHPVPASFANATPDGTFVFFFSTAPLLDEAIVDAGRGDLYRLNTRTGELVLVTGPGDHRSGEDVFFDANEAGDRVYFNSSRKLVPAAAEGANNLYEWHDGQVHLIYSAGTYGDGFGVAVHVSPSGRFAAFETGAPVTGYDSTNQPSCAGIEPLTGIAILPVCSEVYVYDAVTQSVACASCDPTGTSNGSSTIYTTAGFETFSYTEVRTVLDDGRVFFDTANALNSRDINGKRDVYEWHDGALRLISPGTAGTVAQLADVTSDGRDVLFTTSERLVGQDRDDSRDMYTARVGGGLASQRGAPDPHPCDGDACQARGETEPAPERVGSDRSAQTGGSPIVERVRVAVVMSAAQRRRLARTGRGSLSVTVNRAGRVEAVATATIKHVRRTVASGHVVAKRAQSVSVPLQISAAGRAELKRARRLSVTVAVRFGGVTKSLTIRLTAASVKATRATIR